MNMLETVEAGTHDLGLIAVKADRRKLGEASVSYDLTDILAYDPQEAFRRFLEIALRLCNAGSAGLSLLRLNEAGEAVIRWQAVSGALAPHEGNESPRDFSPCGLCLDAATTTILPDPQRAFPFLKATSPWISEDLMVPLYDDTQKSLGTLWIAHHDAASSFGAADTQVVQQLAPLLQRILRMLEKDKCCQIPLVLLELHEIERHAIARGLTAERNRRELAEASESKLREEVVFKNAEIQDAYHRVKNTIQIAASFLQLQARISQFAAERTALKEGYRRLHLLADVHELLYKGSDTARKICMRDLLQKVTETLRLSFFEKDAQVQLRTAIEPIVLAAEDAIPLASLVNEAVTNAYKYAFPGRAGEIMVTLGGAAEEALVLRITDNGIGLPAQTSKSGLGFDLIQSFAAQLGGALLLATRPDSPGTMLTLTIPDRAGLRPAAQLQAPCPTVMNHAAGRVGSKRSLAAWRPHE